MASSNYRALVLHPSREAYSHFESRYKITPLSDVLGNTDRYVASGTAETFDKSRFKNRCVLVEQRGIHACRETLISALYYMKHSMDSMGIGVNFPLILYEQENGEYLTESHIEKIQKLFSKIIAEDMIIKYEPVAQFYDRPCVSILHTSYSMKNRYLLSLVLWIMRSDAILDILNEHIHDVISMDSFLKIFARLALQFAEFGGVYNPNFLLSMFCYVEQSTSFYKPKIDTNGPAKYARALPVDIVIQYLREFYIPIMLKGDAPFGHRHASTFVNIPFIDDIIAILMLEER